MDKKILKIGIIMGLLVTFSIVGMLIAFQGSEDVQKDNPKSNQESNNENNKDNKEPEVVKGDDINKYANEKDYSSIVPVKDAVNSEKAIELALDEARNTMHIDFEKAYFKLGDSLMTLTGENKKEAEAFYSDMARYYSLKNASIEKRPSIVKKIKDPEIYAMGIGYLQEYDIVEIVITPESKILPGKGAILKSFEKLDFDFEKAKNGTEGIFSEIYKEFDHELVPPKEESFNVYKAVSHIKLPEGEADFTFYVVNNEKINHIYSMSCEDEGNLIGMIRTKYKIMN